VLARDVALHVCVHRRGAWRGRGDRIADCRQGIQVSDDLLCGVLRLVCGLGDHQGERLADVVDLVSIEDRPATRFHLGAPIGQTSGNFRKVSRGPDGEDAGHRPGG
jgi:hypothetical protein